MEIVSKDIWHNSQEQQLATALDNAALISITDPKGIIIYTNDSFCEISGYNEQELLGQNHSILKSGKQSDRVFKELWATISANRVWKGDICNKKKDGSFYWVNATIIPFVDDSGSIEKYVAIRFDITKSKENVYNLKLIENKFKLIFDAAPDAYFITDLNGKILECNVATETISGYNKNELLNKYIIDLGLLNKTDSTFFLRILKIASTKLLLSHFQITSKTGEQFDLEIMSHHTSIDGKALVLNIARDITKSNITLKKLKEKTSDLELLLYRSGHDLRTPFTSMEGLVNLIKLEPISESSLEIINMIENVLKEGKMLIDNLSTSSAMLTKSIQKEEVDLNQLIKQTLKNLEHTEGFNNVSFNVNIQKPFKFITNTQVLNSILQNLLQNAIKYQRPFSNTHTPFIIVNAFKIKNGVTISIKDNGKGILDNELDKVFDLYYRSHTTVNGSGLGLYITKNSVEQLNGTIHIKSVVNKETQIDIELPNLPL
jgi:PAS domain S-box-containing protein